MGQRLFLGIRYKGHTLAGAYYHWSGYTIPAINLLKEVHKYIENSDEPNKYLLAIRALEHIGAGFETDSSNNCSEIDALHNTFFPNETFNKESDRNEGILSASFDGIEELLKCSEFSCYFDMDTMTSDFAVVNFYDSLADVKDNFDNLNPASIPSFSMNLYKMTYIDLCDLETHIYDNDVIQCGGEYISILA